MQKYSSLQQAKLKNAWVTIGTFDGVHIGHKTVISNLAHAAHAAGEQAVVVTFFPYPAVFLRKIQNPYYLTTPEERIQLIEETSADAVISLEFDQSIANLSADTFTGMLVESLGMKHVWVGEGFALGKDREGNIHRLAELGKKYGFEVKTVEPVMMNDAVISSSSIRTAIEVGDVTKAAELLGRPYRLSGTVVKGAGRGTGLGFPTANLQPDPIKIIPANGIYVTWAWWQRKRFPGVTNVGLRPTFDDGLDSPVIEPYIIDFDQNLYGESLTLEFIQYIRSEEKFLNSVELSKQIQADVDLAKEVFSRAPRTPRLSS